MVAAHPLGFPGPVGEPHAYEAELLDLHDLPPEQRAEIERDLADIAAGRAKLVPHAVVQQMIAEMKRRQIDCSACGGAEEGCAHCAGSGMLCKECGKPWVACVEAGACEPPELRGLGSR